MSGNFLMGTKHRDKTITSTARLNNGVEIPYLGLGVYLAGAGTGTRKAIQHALEASYRHIDTARLYGNEQDEGIAQTFFGSTA